MTCTTGAKYTGVSLPDWVELANTESHAVSLQGWQLNGGKGSSYTFPADVSIPANGYLLVYVLGDDKPLGSVSSPVLPAACVRAPLTLKRKSVSLQLLRSDQSSASVLGKGQGSGMSSVAMLPDVSFGIPDAKATTAAGIKTDGGATAGGYTYLATPTPGAANSAAKAVGPFVIKVSGQDTHAPWPKNTDLPLNITVAPNLNPVKSIAVTYLANYGPEVSGAATPVIQAAERTDTSLYTATVPAAVLAAGSMVRWYVTATDSQGYTSRSPPCTGPNGSSCSYHGTMVAPDGMTDPEVPALFWYTPSYNASATVKGAGNSSLFFNGGFYDGVRARRRGVTSLSWPKPKFKFVLEDKEFRWRDDAPTVNTFGLQSFWSELGEPSYMREVLALTAMQEAGDPAPTSFHVQVWRNGVFFGLFSYVEEVDDVWLKTHGYSPQGPLIKSESGELSNMRYDLAPSQMKDYYGKSNRKNVTDDWTTLYTLLFALGGGGPETRTHTLYDMVNLPQVINDMAIQTLLLNLDRCTKNFYLYLDPDTQEWYRFPWDLDGALGQDNKLGGKPGPNYCVLACEQWNSPLYCDSEHPQDISRKTPWGTVTTSLLEPQSYGRKVLTYGSSAPPPQILAAGDKITKFPTPVGWANPDLNQTVKASTVSAPGTYNYLSDAVLDVNSTRSMYLRRLRTLSDRFLGPSGRLFQITNATYTLIKPLADKDAKLWNSGINIDRGFQQLTTEFIPIRTEQLVGSLYGPNGTHPLLPTAQSPSAKATIGHFEQSVAQPSQSYLQINNTDPVNALDVSGWYINGTVSHTFAPGTVIPSQSSVYVTPDLVAFRSRPASPTGNQGLFVVGPLLVLSTAPQSHIQLNNAVGTLIDQL
ncbi:MAG: hypothetical protein WDW36_009419 [Sanguina aurantia]